MPVEIYATTARLYYLQSEKHCKGAIRCLFSYKYTICCITELNVHSAHIPSLLYISLTKIMELC